MNSLLQTLFDMWRHGAAAPSTNQLDQSTASATGTAAAAPAVAAASAPPVQPPAPPAWDPSGDAHGGSNGAGGGPDPRTGGGWGDAHGGQGGGGGGTQGRDVYPPELDHDLTSQPPARYPSAGRDAYVSPGEPTTYWNYPPDANSYGYWESDFGGDFRVFETHSKVYGMFGNGKLAWQYDNGQLKINYPPPVGLAVVPGQPTFIRNPFTGAIIGVEPPQSSAELSALACAIASRSADNSRLMGVTDFLNEFPAHDASGSSPSCTGRPTAG